MIVIRTNEPNSSSFYLKSDQLCSIKSYDSIKIKRVMSFLDKIIYFFKCRTKLNNVIHFIRVVHTHAHNILMQEYR